MEAAGGSLDDGKIAMRPVDAHARGHIRALDGWRGISILLVLAAHLLPLGTPAFKVNVEAGVGGMVIFFILSGFLITSILLAGVSVPSFVVRRFLRVVPLAWLFCAAAAFFGSQTPVNWWSHLLFYANLPPQSLVPVTAHMWSLCVEMQFYTFVALWYAITGIRGLIWLPVFGLAFSSYRGAYDIYAGSITYERIDEILAGCALALIWHGRMGTSIGRWIAAFPQWLAVVLLALSCFNISPFFWFRPYLAALLVGTTLYNPHSALSRWLDNRFLIFVASISYALYVIHPLLAETWLGSGGLAEKYAKRPLLLIALFGLAYLSTNYYERFWNRWGRRW